MGGTSETISSTFIEYAIFIVLLPMLAFPIILFLGTHLQWKPNMG